MTTGDRCCVSVLVVLACLGSCSTNQAEVDYISWDWLPLDPVARSVLHECTDKGFVTPSGTTWRIFLYLPERDHVPLPCGTMWQGSLITREADSPPTAADVLPPGLYVTSDARKPQILRGLSEGDVADLYRRVTGKEHPTLKGKLSADYKAFLEGKR